MVDFPADHPGHDLQANAESARSASLAGDELFKRGQLPEALGRYVLATQLSPGEAVYSFNAGLVCWRLGKVDVARQHIERAIALSPGVGRFHRILSQIHCENGRIDAALYHARRAMELAPDDPEIAALHIMLASLLDSQGHYDKAFAHARLAHQARGVRYDPRRIERLVDERIELFTRATLQCLARASESSDKPVFILGMPRSGTSLVEQVLASHQMVHGAGELNWIGRIEHAALQRAPAEGRQTLDLRRCSLAVINELASQYLRPLVALNPQASRITDKMPLNFLNLGLIAMLFPDARVIHCIRDPLDTCLSCYLTELSVGNEFTADLATLSHFYNQYRRMMDHWKQVLDYSILNISYESMVEDLESHARRMLEFLGLPWNPRCLSFHENRRLIDTASNSQVRQPLYGSSVGRWKHYAKHLEPLRLALRATSPFPSKSP